MTHLSQEEIADQLVTILRSLGFSWVTRGISPDADIYEDLGFDSFDLYDVLLSIEEHFNIIIDEMRLVDVRTVGAVVSLIELSLSD